MRSLESLTCFQYNKQFDALKFNEKKLITNCLEPSCGLTSVGT